RFDFPDKAGHPGLAILFGLSWLSRLQNRDGGMPTFCRGWGKLPFDRSGTDLTAHAIRAIHAWGARFLADGTSVRLRVLSVLARAVGLPVRVNGVLVPIPSRDQLARTCNLGLDYLAREQRPDGSWLPLWFGNQHTPDDSNPTYGTAKVLAAYRDIGLL